MSQALLTETDRIRHIFYNFELPSNDCGWTEIEGCRLIMTPSGLCTREDLQGRLMHAQKDWYIQGRDDHRIIAYRSNIASFLTMSLVQSVIVDKALVLGKKKQIITERTSAKRCIIDYLRVDCMGVSRWGFVMPKPFVCYDQGGSFRFRQLVD